MRPQVTPMRIKNHHLAAIATRIEAIPNLTMSLAPPPEATYPDIATAFAAIQTHAKAHGYAVFQRDKRANKVVYTCDRAGQYDSKGKDPHTHSTKRRKGTGSKKCGCLMKVILRLDKVLNTYTLEVLEALHNHGPSAATVAHPAHRVAALVPETRAQISSLTSAGFLPGQILTALREADPEVTLISKDIANLAQKSRREELNGLAPIQWLLQVISPFFPLSVLIYSLI
jgi:hypothetical protein